MHGGVWKGRVLGKLQGYLDIVSTIVKQDQNKLCLRLETPSNIITFRRFIQRNDTENDCNSSVKPVTPRY